MRLATLPAAIRIERCPLFEGVIGPPEVLFKGEPATGFRDRTERPVLPHVDLAAARAIYERLRSQTSEPAVCVELGDVLWVFVMNSGHAAHRWTDEFVQIARKGR